MYIFHYRKCEKTIFMPLRREINNFSLPETPSQPQPIWTSNGHPFTNNRSPETNLHLPAGVYYTLVICWGQITHDQDTSHTIPIREDTLQPRATGND